MLDETRGERIRQLRESRHLTGPAVVELMRERGGLRNDGRPFISYRQYQKYEAGGGIGLDRLRVLADVLGTTGDYILRGEGDRRVPRERRSADAEPVAVDRLEGELEARMNRIEAKVDEILEQRLGFIEVLAEQTKLLAMIGDLVGSDTLRKRADEAVQSSIEKVRADLAAAQAHGSQSSVPGPATTAETSELHRSPEA